MARNQKFVAWAAAAIIVVVVGLIMFGGFQGGGATDALYQNKTQGLLPP